MNRNPQFLIRVYPHSFVANLFIFFCVVLMCLGVSTGCGTLPSGRGWGEDATLAPGWERVGRAAWNAAVSPATWGPAAGALALQAGNADKKISEWAATRTPVYGSRQSAAQASDDLVNVAEGAFVITALAAPSGDEPGEWAINKIKGFAVGEAAVLATRTTTNVLKRSTGRERPDGSDDLSFPSGHASSAAVYATLASRNVDALSLPGGAETASQAGLGLIVAGTGWARVEANKHYPSDVLFGAALGHFFGAFITDAFLGLDNPHHFVPAVEPSKEGVVLLLTFDF